MQEQEQQSASAPQPAENPVRPDGSACQTEKSGSAPVNPDGTACPEGTPPCNGVPESSPDGSGLASKVVSIGTVLLVVAFVVWLATAILPIIFGLATAVVKFLFDVLLFALVIVAVIKFVAWYNEPGRKAAREQREYWKEQKRAYKRQASAACRNAAADVMFNMGVNMAGGSSTPCPPPPSNPAPATPNASVSGVDQEAYRKKHQQAQEAYWHRNQAAGCPSGSTQERYHDNAAAQAQWQSDHTTYR